MNTNDLDQDVENSVQKEGTTIKKHSHIKSCFIDDSDLCDEEFEKKTKFQLISSIFLMIVGVLFAYYGFYFLTQTFTVRWGALFIAVGLFILMFAFSLWQDTHIMTIRRQLTNEIRLVLKRMEENRDK